MAYDHIDPRMLAAALGGRSNSASFGGGPTLLAAPEQRMRQLYAQQLLGADPASARTTGEGVARLGQQLLGAYLAREGMDEEKARRAGTQQAMAEALRAMSGRPAEARTYQDPNGGDSTTINWNPQKPDPARAMDIMANDPTLAPQALGMQLQQQQERQKLALKMQGDAFEKGFAFDPATGGVSALPGGWGDPRYQGGVAYSKSAGEAAGRFPYDTAKDAYGANLDVWKAGETPYTLGAGDTRFGGAGMPQPAPSMRAPTSTGGTQTVPRTSGGGPLSDIPLSPQARATIGVESGGSVDAASGTSSATGPAQFIDSTWLSMMQKHAPGLIQGKSRDEVLAMRSDPEIAGAMTDAYAKENDAALRAAGLEPTQADLHFAHTFGSGGAINMMKADQRAPAANLNSRAVVEANRPLFFEPNGRPRTVAELRQTLADRFNRNLPQETTGTMPVMQPPAAGAPMPQVTPPGTADAMPNPAAPLGVQVADAGTVATDATLAGGARVIARGAPARKLSTIDLGTSTGVLDGNTGEVVRTIPKDVAGEAAARKTGEAQAQRVVDAPKAVQQADMVLSSIDGTLNHPGFEWGTGKSSWTTHIPGTPAYDFGKRVEQLQGQTFLQAFESLKGGGAISEMEGKKAQAAIARLDNAQTEEGFRQALGELRGIVTAARERAIVQGGGATQQAPQQAAPNVDHPPLSTPSTPALPPGFSIVGG